jgi:hypothetical protein
MNNDEQEQTSMYQERKRIHQSLRPLAFARHHREYITGYLRRNGRRLLVVLGLIGAQALLELSALLVTARLGAQGLADIARGDSAARSLAYALAGAIAYLVIAFMATKREREAVLGLINDLRHRLFSGMLGHDERSVTHEAKANFIAKVSYHLPTLSLGLDRSLFGCVRWMLSACLIIALGLATGSEAMVLAISAIIASVALMIIAYVIAMHYVSREVTAYSQIMKHICLSLAEFPSVKAQRLEGRSLRTLDSLVATDTYMRVRRDLWLRYLNRILFALLFVAGVCVSVFSLPYPRTLASAAISLYAIRLLYQALQTGLYLPPLRLGLFLSIQPGSPQAFGQKRRGGWKSLTFRSNKTRLFPEGPYLKDVSISIRKGESHLFTGGSSSGKTSLAFLFGDKPLFNPTGWIVIEDGQRLSADDWAIASRDRYLFGPQFRTEKTLGEIILGKDRQDIRPDDIERIYAMSERYPALAKQLSKKRFAGESALAFEHNPSALFCIQALHCVMSEAGLIVIDNSWIDLGYEEIDEAIRTLSRELPNSTIVMFARQAREIIDNQKNHEIRKGEIS